MSDEEWMALYQEALARMRRVNQILDEMRVKAEAIEARVRT